MEVEFYNRDARDVFLSPKSVDLFLIHPPYFTMNKDRYGGDPDLQINKTDDREEFSKFMVKYIKNMSDAMTDDGNILVIVPNYHNAFYAIADIIKNTDLILYKVLTWNFEKTKFDKAGNNYSINFILHLRKNTNFTYPIENLESLVIDQEWVHSDKNVSKYEDLGFVYDGFPIEISDILVKAFSKEGDTVADIFGGTGTTIISALQNNRKAIYNDASSEQVQVAKVRINNIINNNEDVTRQAVEQVLETYEPLEIEEQDIKRKEVLKAIFAAMEDIEREEARKQSGAAMQHTQKMFKENVSHLMIRVNAIYEGLLGKDMLK